MKTSRSPLAHYASRDLSKDRLDRLWPGVGVRIVRARRRRRIAVVGGTAAVAIALVAVVRLQSGEPGAGEVIATDAGRTVARTLGDGTRLTVGPSSRVGVLAARRRSVRLQLEHGTADLVVPPVAGRSFTVEAGGFDVAVRGTRFRVELSDAFEPEIMVSVSEGRVDVRQHDSGALVSVVSAGNAWSAFARGPSLPRLVPPAATASAPATPEAAPTEVLRAAETVRPSDLGADEFLSRRGRQLMWGDKPYRFLGYTAFTLTGCGLPEQVPTPAETRAFMAGLRPHTIVRTMAFEHQGMVAIENVVEMARSFGHKVILVLSDHHGYCGDGGTRKTRAFYESDFRKQLLPWVRTIATRLKDSPAVAMWELVKEPVDVPPEVLRGFFDAVGGELRQIAPRHLILSGSHGPFAYGGDEGYRLIHDSPAIDVASYIDYNLGWTPAESLASAQRALVGVDKPIIVASLAFGASRTGEASPRPGARGCANWATRVEAMRGKLISSFARGIAGATIWSWMPHGAGSCRMETYPEDPLMEFVRDFNLDGDPGRVPKPPRDGARRAEPDDSPRALP